MNALEALICVITMQLATTLKGATPALATVDIQAVGFLVQVSVAIQSSYNSSTLNYLHLYKHLDTNECLTNNGGCHHNCHNSVGSYSCSCNNGYRLNSNGYTCEGRLSSKKILSSDKHIFVHTATLLLGDNIPYCFLVLCINYSDVAGHEACNIWRHDTF